MWYTALSTRVCTVKQATAEEQEQAEDGVKGEKGGQNGGNTVCLLTVLWTWSTEPVQYVHGLHSKAVLPGAYPDLG